MIGSVKEAEVFGEMKKFIDGYDNYRYSFIDRGSERDGFLKLLTGFRYTQPKVTNKDRRIDLYPGQLITLARYYYHHDSGSKNSRAETVRRVEEFVDSLYDTVIAYYNTDITRGRANKLKNHAYDIPQYDNEVSLDTIINEAVYSGELFAGEYPSPEGLAIVDSEYEYYSFPAGCSDEDKKKLTEEFWLDHLNNLYERYENHLIMIKKLRMRKQNKPYEEESVTKDRALNDKSALLPQKVETAFLVSVWYAYKLQELRRAMNGKELTDDKRYFVYDEARLKRVFMSMNKPFEIEYEEFSSYFRCASAGSLKTMCCLFKSDRGGNVSRITELPSLSELDSGYRLRESSLNWFYSISLKTINALIDIVCPAEEKGSLRSMLTIANITQFEERSDKTAMCYRFNTSPETDMTKMRIDLDRILRDELTKIAGTLADSITTAQKKVITGDENAKNIDSIMSETFYRAAKSDGKCIDTGENEPFKKLFETIMANTKNYKKDFTADARKFAEKLHDSYKKKGDEVTFDVGKLRALMLNTWKKSYPHNDTRAKGTKEAKELFDAMCQDDVKYLIGLSDPAENIAKVAARIRTMVLMMFDDYSEFIGKSAENRGKFLPWYATPHLCISDELLECETKYIEDYFHRQEQNQ